jgi:hypothetical protein
MQRLDLLYFKKTITHSIIYVLMCCLTAGFTNFTSSELKALTNNFSNQHVIGKGGSAIVYKVPSIHVLGLS